MMHEREEEGGTENGNEDNEMELETEKVENKNSLLKSEEKLTKMNERRMQCTMKKLHINMNIDAKPLGVDNVLKILQNEDANDIRILRLKNFGLPPMCTEAMMEQVLDALMKCKSVQVLYIQNFPEGMKDKHLNKLIQVLKLNHIWGLNVGETWNVSRAGWEKFADDLADTHVTHMYVSEGTVISADLKTKMMNVIRENRKKDKRHMDKHNRDVIDNVSNMWFNPRASEKYQSQFAHLKRENDIVYDLDLFVPGTVCWARLPSRPMWPCVVRDPKSLPGLPQNSVESSQVLVYVLGNTTVNDDDISHHSIVGSDAIQPWTLKRCNDKMDGRMPKYSRAIRQAALLYLQQQKSRLPYISSFSVLVENCNDLFHRDCCVLDSLLPGGDGLLRDKSLVWVKSCGSTSVAQVHNRNMFMTLTPEYQKALGTKSESWILVQFFGGNEWQWVKYDAITPIPDYFPTETLLRKNSAIKNGIQHCTQMVEQVMQRLHHTNLDGDRVTNARIIARKHGLVVFDPSARIFLGQTSLHPQGRDTHCTCKTTLDPLASTCAICYRLIEHAPSANALTSFRTHLNRRTLESKSPIDYPIFTNSLWTTPFITSKTSVFNTPANWSIVFLSQTRNVSVASDHKSSIFRISIPDCELSAVFLPNTEYFGFLAKDFEDWLRTLGVTSFAQINKQVLMQVDTWNSNSVYSLRHLIDKLALLGTLKKFTHLTKLYSKTTISQVVKLHNMCSELCSYISPKARSTDALTILREAMGFSRDARPPKPETQPESQAEHPPIAETPEPPKAQEPTAKTHEVSDDADAPSKRQKIETLAGRRVSNRQPGSSSRQCNLPGCLEFCMGEYCSTKHQREHRKLSMPQAETAAHVQSKPPATTSVLSAKDQTHVVTELLKPTQFYNTTPEPLDQDETPNVTPRYFEDSIEWIQMEFGGRRKRNQKSLPTCANPSCGATVSGIYCSDICKRDHQKKQTTMKMDLEVGTNQMPSQQSTSEETPENRITPFESCQEDNIRLFQWVAQLQRDVYHKNH